VTTTRTGDHPAIGAGARFAVLAEGFLADVHGKLAHGVLRFRPDSVVAVVDSTLAGRTANRIVPGVAAEVPIVESLEAALALRPTALLVGVTPPGGELPQAWRPVVVSAIEARLDVVSGMHRFLADDPELARLAAARGVRLADLRRPPERVELATGRVLDLDGVRVVLTVGDDAAVGKMTAALALTAAIGDAGDAAAFVATGQTGIAIAGWGVAIDRVIGDFMAGVAEELVLRAAESARTIVVEGQGSLAHPAFSGVTLALMHGAAPTDLILCHDPGRRTVIDYGRKQIPPLAALIHSYTDLARYVRPATIRGIAVNTSALAPARAEQLLARIEHETGLPAEDVVRSGATKLTNALLAASSTAEGRVTTKGATA